MIRCNDCKKPRQDTDDLSCPFCKENAKQTVLRPSRELLSLVEDRIGQKDILITPTLLETVAELKAAIKQAEGRGK